MEMVPLVPTNPAALDPAKISPQLSTFAGLIDRVHKVRPRVKGPLVEAFIKGVQSMLLKEKTVDRSSRTRRGAEGVGADGRSRSCEGALDPA